MGVRMHLSLSYAQEYTSFLIRLISTMVLARLLTPAEIGTFSVAAIFVGIAHMFREFGTGEYIVRQPGLTDEQIRSTQAITLMMGWGLGVVVLLISGPVARFYSEPEAQAVLLVLALNMFLLPFASVLRAYLRRQFRFGVLYLVRLANRVVQASSSIALAAMGFGALSLAWGATLGGLATVISLQFFRPKGFPIRPRFRELGEIASFSAYVTGQSVMKEIEDGGPELVLGRTAGMEEAGLYGRAQGFRDLFKRILMAGAMPVATPHFARLINEEGDGAACASFVRSTRMVVGLGWPVFVVAGLLMDPLILILFGPQWGETVAPARILAMLAVVELVYSLAPRLITAKGNVRGLFFAQMISLPLGVMALILAAPFGLTAIAGAFAVQVIVRNWLTHRLLKSGLGVTSNELLSIARQGVAVTVPAVIGPVALVLWLGLAPASPWLLFLAGILSAAVGNLVGLSITSHPLWDEIKGGLRRIPGRRGRPGAAPRDRR